MHFCFCVRFKTLSEMVAWIYINFFFFLLFQTLEETITVIVPQNAKNVYDSIVEIINAFKIIIKDPKTAMIKIGKGAMT